MTESATLVIEGVDLRTALSRGRTLWLVLGDNPYVEYTHVVDQVRAQLSAWRGAPDLIGIMLAVEGRRLAIEGLKALVLFGATGKILPLPPAVRLALQAALVQVDVMHELEKVGFLSVHYGAQEANSVPGYIPGGVTDQLYKEILGEDVPTEIWHTPLAARYAS